MELYTAIILLCTFNGTEVDTCSTITYPEPFQNRLECQKNMDKHEMASGAT
jgi:hypothetical protein